MAWTIGNYALSQEQMNANALEVYKYLSARGWSLNAIAGLLGNMQSESYVNPGVWQSLQANNYSGGFGLVQWTPATNYTDWARQNGYDIADPNGQLYWIDALSESTGQWIPTKGKGYLGAGSERNTFQILFNIIKGATKNSQSLFQGCTGYSFQYSASIESADAHTYFPVTNAQAQNILVGSYVSVGYGQLNDGKNGVNNDRGVANIHKYADDVKVLKIETLDANNKAVYLDIETGFNTMPIKLSDTVNAPITITSMHWWSGSTDAVIGRHDGSFGSNTDSKHPYRVQGREYAVGGYMVASDTVMDFQSDYSKKVYVAPKGVAHCSSDAMIRKTYTCVGTIPANPDGNGSDFWVGDIAVDVDTGAWFPSAKGSSNSQGFADMVYAGGKTTSGMREYLQGGPLGAWSIAGSACVVCWGGLAGAHWNFLGCD